MLYIYIYISRKHALSSIFIYKEYSFKQEEVNLSIIILHVDTQIQVNYTFTPITRYRFPAIVAFISYPVKSDKIWRKQTATDYSYPLIDTLLNYSIIKAKSVSCCVCFLYQPWMNFFAVLVSFSLAYFFLLFFIYLFLSFFLCLFVWLVGWLVS